MWLLHTKKRVLKNFVSENGVPKYAIVSHRWEDDEVTFQEMRNKTADKKKGYKKVDRACKQAVKDGFSWIWFDGACINQESSAELSLAINAMFRWYYKADVCYAYLGDVLEGHQRRLSTPGKDITVYWAETQKVLKDCLWFTRGWTLQELLAPEKVEFFDSGWEALGNKAGMVKILSEITGIDAGVLRNRDTLSTYPVATRMSWAARRSTLMAEDRAYSLIGIFDVNMPLLYGEGDKAFIRLQEEIMKVSLDHSILTWDPWEKSHACSLFSPSPYGFRNAKGILTWTYLEIDEPFTLSNKGLRITLPTFERNNQLLAVLNCHYEDGFLKPLALRLSKQPTRPIIPRREVPSTLCQLSTSWNTRINADSHWEVMDEDILRLTTWRDLIILRKPQSLMPGVQQPGWEQKILIYKPKDYFMTVASSYPQGYWDNRQSIMSLPMTGVPQMGWGYLVFNGPLQAVLAFEQRMEMDRPQFNICLKMLNQQVDGFSVAKQALSTQSRTHESMVSLGNGKRMMASAQYRLLMGAWLWAIKILIV